MIFLSAFALHQGGDKCEQEVTYLAILNYHRVWREDLEEFPL